MFSAALNDQVTGSVQPSDAETHGIIALLSHDTASSQGRLDAANT